MKKEGWTVVSLGKSEPHTGISVDYNHYILFGK